MSNGVIMKIGNGHGTAVLGVVSGGSDHCAAPRLVSLKSCFFEAWDTPASFINFKKKGLML